MTDNKVALITGAGKKRIGWHVAEALAQRGYAAAIHYHQSVAAAHETVKEFRQRGYIAEAYQADLTEEAQVQNLVAQVLDRFHRIDALVTCAAVWPRKKLEDTTAGDVRANFEANTLSTFLCCQQVGLAMVRQPEGGAIVTLGDWATIRPYTDYAAYFPSKGAIPALTRSLAVELGTRNPNVRVNCILPGPVMLPAEMSDEERQRVIQATLVKREGRPGHIAQAVVLFLENDFLTGVCLPVDGGRSIFATDSER